MTWIFQEIINTYGVPSYQEANPAPFAIVTFPFMFGMMFGDYGHGSLIFALGVFLIMMNSKLKGNGMDEFLKARYMILGMGFFAMFNGLLYNEFFAIPNDWFGTCYDLS